MPACVGTSFFLSAAVIKELSLWLKVSAGVRRL